MTVKRVLSFLSGLALVLFGPLGRLPAWAQLLTLGVGGIVASGVLMPPAITPQLSAAFDSNIPLGVSNNGFKVNGGGAFGAMELPTTTPNSYFQTIEGTTDAALSTSASQSEGLFGSNLYVAANGGPATFVTQVGWGGRSRRGGGWNWVGVVSGLFNPNDSGVGALERRPRHDEGYHEGGGCGHRSFAFG